MKITPKATKTSTKRTRVVPTKRVVIKRTYISDRDCFKLSPSHRYQRKTPPINKVRKPRQLKALTTRKPANRQKKTYAGRKMDKGTMPHCLNKHHKVNETGGSCLEVITDWFDFYFSSGEPRCRSKCADRTDSGCKKRQQSTETNSSKKCPSNKHTMNTNKACRCLESSPKFTEVSEKKCPKASGQDKVGVVECDEVSCLTPSELHCLRQDEINFQDDYYYY